MDEDPALSEGYRMASPWPLFVALGVPISEIGILFDLFPVAVGGLLLFSVSVAGMAREAGYVRSPWRALLGLAAALFVVGGVLAFSDVALVTRGYAVIVAGGLLTFGSVVGRLVIDDRPRPA